MPKYITVFLLAIMVIGIIPVSLNSIAATISTTSTNPNEQPLLPFTGIQGNAKNATALFGKFGMGTDFGLVQYGVNSQMGTLDIVNNGQVPFIVQTQMNALTLGEPTKALTNSTYTILNWNQIGSYNLSQSYLSIPYSYNEQINIFGSVATNSVFGWSFFQAGGKGSICDIGCTQFGFGGMLISWADIVQAGYQTSFNNQTDQLSVNIPAGNFNLDPIAIDASGKCNSGVSSSCTMTLTTSNAKDYIVVLSNCDSGSGCGVVPPYVEPNDTKGLTYNYRQYMVNPTFTVSILESIAYAPTTLSSDVITCYSINKISCNAFAVSGLTNPFDNNITVPCINNGHSGAISCSLSTSNKADMVFGLMGSDMGGFTCTPQGGFANIQDNCGDTDGSATSMFQIFTTTFSGSFSWTVSATVNWAMIGDAFTNQSSSGSTTTVTSTSTITSTSTTTITTNGSVTSTITVPVTPEPAGSTDLLLILIAIIISLILLVVGIRYKTPFPSLLGATVLLLVDVGLYTNNKIVYGQNILNTPLWFTEILALFVIVAYIIPIYQLVKRRY